MEVLEAELWQRVDHRLDEVRRPAPGCSHSGEPPPGTPFAFGPRATIAGPALCAVLLLIFLLLA
jgi:hypothetical protein